MENIESEELRNPFSDPDSLPTAAARFAVVMTAHPPGRKAHRA